MATEFKLSYTANEINSKLGEIDNLAKKSEVPTKVSDLTNDSGYLTSFTETDPTVPAWAKASTKPTYTAAEVGAVSENELTNVVNEALASAKASGEFDGKSAYQYATDGGYAGTEAEFAEDVNPDNINDNSISFITAEIAKRQQLEPVFANSVEDMTDTTKVYVLCATNEIWGYKRNEIVHPETNFNVFDKSAATINGRLSNGQPASSTSGSNGCFITDFIELTDWSALSTYMVRVNFEINSPTADYNQANFYDENKNFISIIPINQSTMTPTVGNGKTSFDLKSGSPSNAKYVKLRLYINEPTVAIATTDLDGVEITFDANITPEYVTYDYGWGSTGHTFVPADYEDRIVDLENGVNDNKVDVTLLKERVLNIESGEGAMVVPEWWEDEVADTIAKIKALQVGKNCVTFPFFSDNHCNTGYSGVLIAKVMKECGIPYCFYGGDAIGSGLIPDETTMIAHDKAFDDMMSYIPEGKFCRAVGNHDGFWKVSSTESHSYTREQIYELFLRAESTAQNKHFGEDGTYYYVNDTASKVRWIVLNIHSVDVDATQIEWFQNTALSFDESGWAVVVISHAPITRHYATLVYNADEVRTVLKNYINGTADNKADVVGWWSGHVHRDRIFEGVAANPGYDGSTNTEEDRTNGDPIAETLPWKTVTIISDNVSIGYGGVKHNVDNSDQSHAIDFVTINKTTRTVNITRLGFGEDRSYTY